MPLMLQESLTLPRSPSASATARLKSKIQQAVFFGDRAEVRSLPMSFPHLAEDWQNPLSFDLPAGFQGDAAEAAEAVSSEIIASSQ